MANDIVKIPTQHYIGMVKRTHDTLPLGFMTPYGEDAAAKKRIATVDSWANSGYYGNTNKIEAQIIDNVPLSGFRLTSSIRSSDYGGADKWRIEDPRGFELEITSGNLARLLSIGMVDKGEIIDQCVWGRYGANNILLSTATDEYKDATRNTEVANKSANWSDVKLGDIVELQNTIRGVWLGRMYTIISGSSHNVESNLGDNQVITDTKMVHVIHVAEIEKKYSEYTEELHLIASPKLSSIEHIDTPLTKAQAEVIANQLLADKNVNIIRNNYKTVLAVSFGKAKVSLSKVQVEVKTLQDLAALSNYERDDLFITGPGNTFGKIECRNYNGIEITVRAFDGVSFDSNELRQLYKPCYRHYSGTGYSEVHLDYRFDPNDYFFNIQLSAVTASGNTFTRNI